VPGVLHHETRHPEGRVHPPAQARAPRPPASEASPAPRAGGCTQTGRSAPGPMSPRTAAPTGVPRARRTGPSSPECSTSHLRSRSPKRGQRGSDKSQAQRRARECTSRGGPTQAGCSGRQPVDAPLMAPQRGGPDAGDTPSTLAEDPMPGMMLTQRGTLFVQALVMAAPLLSGCASNVTTLVEGSFSLATSDSLQSFPDAALVREAGARPVSTLPSAGTRGTHSSASSVLRCHSRTVPAPAPPPWHSAFPRIVPIRQR